MDLFLLLTPIFVLALVALLGFVGCGFQPVAASPPSPTGLNATAGNGSVQLSWTDVVDSDFASYNVKRGTTQGGPYATLASVTAPAFTDTSVTNGTTYYYVVTTVETGGSESTPSNEASATPFVLTNFVIPPVTLGGLRDMNNNPFTGLAGMAIQVGASPLTVRTLGRYSVSGNARTHVLTIVDAVTGQDVPGGSVTIPVDGSPDTFIYANLSSPVMLAAGATYYVVSAEDTTNGGDAFYDQDTRVNTTAVAMITTAVYQFQGTTAFNTVPGSAGRTYGPLDFQY